MHLFFINQVFDIWNDIHGNLDGCRWRCLGGHHCSFNRSDECQCAKIDGISSSIGEWSFDSSNISTVTTSLNRPIASWDKTGFRKVAPVLEGYVVLPEKPDQVFQLLGIDPFAGPHFDHICRFGGETRESYSIFNWAEYRCSVIWTGWTVGYSGWRFFWSRNQACLKNFGWWPFSKVRTTFHVKHSQNCWLSISAQLRNYSAKNLSRIDLILVGGDKKIKNKLSSSMRFFPVVPVSNHHKLDLNLLTKWHVPSTWIFQRWVCFRSL